jgi:hypothetical protein
MNFKTGREQKKEKFSEIANKTKVKMCLIEIFSFK